MKKTTRVVKDPKGKAKSIAALAPDCTPVTPAVTWEHISGSGDL